MSVSKSFTAVGVSLELTVRNNESFTYDVSGSFVGTVAVEQLLHKGNWESVAAATTTANGTITADSFGKPAARFRIRCLSYASGTIVTLLTEATSEVSQQVLDANHLPLLQFSEAGVTVPAGKTLGATSPNLSTPLGAVAVIERTFTEVGGILTYTGAVVVPAGAAILDILVNGIALWDNAGAVTLKVGDTDDDGYYTNVNLKATDLLAGESLSFALAGGKAGAYIANSQVSPRYSATARTINGIITAAGAGGSLGRTRMTVVYAMPVSADIAAATSA